MLLDLPDFPSDDKCFGSPLNPQLILITNSSRPELARCRTTQSGWNYSLFDFLDEGSVATVYASPDVSGEFWAGLSRKSGADTSRLWRSTDDGVGWTNYSSSLPFVRNVLAITARPLNPNELYIGTDIGVFQSLDGGRSWIPFQDGMPIVMCTDLRYVVDTSRNGQDYLVAATYGRGLYERLVPTNPIVYVDQNAAGYEDGTYEHPFNTYDDGLTAVPSGGTFGLRGNQTYTMPSSIDARQTIGAYGGRVRLTRASTTMSRRGLAK